MNFTRENIEGKLVLLIDDDVEFCLILRQYLLDRLAIVEVSQTMKDGLVMMNLKRPEIIIAGEMMRGDTKAAIEKQIGEMNNYDPSVYIIDSERRDNSSDGGIISRIINFLKDKFRR